MLDHGQVLDASLSYRPDKFAPYSFSQVEVRQVICLACKAIAAMARMQREVEEEERCFKQFGAWLHFGATLSLSLRLQHEAD